jgi:ribonucleoside-diphosphate reductase alpha chain
MTDDADIRMAQSVMDYIFRRLALDYLPFDARAALGIYSAAERARALETGDYTPDEKESIGESVKNSQSVKIEKAPTDNSRLDHQWSYLKRWLGLNQRCTTLHDMWCEDENGWIMFRL